MIADIARIDSMLAASYGVPTKDRGPSWLVDNEALWDQRKALARVRDAGFTVVDNRKVR